jgi:hypothetical protein
MATGPLRCKFGAGKLPVLEWTRTGTRRKQCCGQWTRTGTRRKQCSWVVACPSALIVFISDSVYQFTGFDLRITQQWFAFHRPVCFCMRQQQCEEEVYVRLQQSRKRSRCCRVANTAYQSVSWVDSLALSNNEYVSIVCLRSQRLPVRTLAIQKKVNTR